MVRTLSLLALATSLAVPSAAQAEWRARPDGASVSYDVLAPIDRAGFGALPIVGPGYNLSSSRLFSAHLFTARMPVRDGITLVAELPVALRDYDISPEADARYDTILEGRTGSAGLYTPLTQRHTRIGLGNPMVGAETRLSDRMTAYGGLRLPVGGRGSAPLDETRLNAPDVVGNAADAERAEAYATGVATLSAGVRGRRPFGRQIEGEIGITTYLSIRDADIALAAGPFQDTRTNLAFVWSGAVRGDAGPVALGLNVVGRIDPHGGWTPERGDPVSAGAQAALRVGPVRPGVQVRNGMGSRGRRVVSLSLDVPLR